METTGCPDSLTPCGTPWRNRSIRWPSRNPSPWPPRLHQRMWRGSPGLPDSQPPDRCSCCAALGRDVDLVVPVRLRVAVHDVVRHPLLFLLQIDSCSPASRARQRSRRSAAHRGGVPWRAGWRTGSVSTLRTCVRRSRPERSINLVSSLDAVAGLPTPDSPRRARVARPLAGLSLRPSSACKSRPGAAQRLGRGFPRDPVIPGSFPRPNTSPPKPGSSTKHVT